MHHRIQNIEFTQVVVSCQDLIRKYAHEQLKALGYDDEEELKFRAASCVSQRDIQVCAITLKDNSNLFFPYRECLLFIVGLTRHMKIL